MLGVMSYTHTSLYCRSGRRGMRVLATALLLGIAPAALHGQEVDWRANGRDVQGTRYSPAAEITRKNVSRLELAWTYRTAETYAGYKTEKATAFEATPLVVDGTMYLGTPLGRVIALDPATGQERWVFDPKIKRDVMYGDFASRGVSTWLDASAPAAAVCRRRIFVATAQSQLIALDARDGRPCAGFGRAGVVDPARDLVFVPTGSAAPDYYGVLRLGGNRYANSIVALRASTGNLVWAFQTVHHDLWDYDNASPPALVTLTHDGAAVPAVLQATKTGMLFVLDRETGRPIFPVEERPVPASDIPGEQASGTQPFTALTPPLSPQRFSPDSIWGTSEAERAACHAAIDSLRNDGIFTPPSVRGTFVMPSNIGGAHWGGVAVDPVRQIAVVPVNRIAAVVQLIPREGFHHEQAMAEDKRLGRDYEYNGMWGTPYVMRRRIRVSPSGLPGTPPPFGTLVAIDLKTGGRLWEVPLGSLTRPLT